MKNNRLWLGFLSVSLLVIVACSKDEPATPTEKETYGDIVGAWINMIASDDSHEVTYLNETDAHVVASADGEVLTFKLSAYAQHRLPWSGNMVPVASHEFRVCACMEIEGAGLNELNDVIHARLNASSTAWTDDILAANKDGSMVQTAAATFRAVNNGMAFEVEIKPNLTSKPRYIVYRFVGEDTFNTSFALGLYQPAKKAQ